MSNAVRHSVRRYLTYSLFIFAVAVVPRGLAAGFNEGDPVPVMEFHVVTPDIYRGGRPDRAALEMLERGGVRTIINLDDDKVANAQEASWAKELGMTELSFPLNSFMMPKDAVIAQVFRELTDPGNYPVYVHCHHGQDRTGMIIGLYRVLEQGWSAKDAYQEMLDDHFHTSLFGLDLYYARKAHFVNATWLRMRWKNAMP